MKVTHLKFTNKEDITSFSVEFSEGKKIYFDSVALLSLESIDGFVVSFASLLSVQKLLVLDRNSQKLSLIELKADLAQRTISNKVTSEDVEKELFLNKNLSVIEANYGYVNSILELCKSKYGFLINKKGVQNAK